MKKAVAIILAAGLLLGFLFYRTGEKDDKEAVSEGKEAP